MCLYLICQDVRKHGNYKRYIFDTKYCSVSISDCVSGTLKKLNNFLQFYESYNQSVIRIFTLHVSKSIDWNGLQIFLACIFVIYQTTCQDSGINQILTMGKILFGGKCFWISLAKQNIVWMLIASFRLKSETVFCLLRQSKEEL